MTMLEIIEVTKSFGGIEAVRGVDLTIREGEIVGLIGLTALGKPRYLIL